MEIIRIFGGGGGRRRRRRIVCRDGLGLERIGAIAGSLYSNIYKTGREYKLNFLYKCCCFAKRAYTVYPDYRARTRRLARAKQ